MGVMVFWGLLAPFWGTSLGAACVFFLKAGFGGSRCSRGSLTSPPVSWCRVHLEPADPRYGAVCRRSSAFGPVYPFFWGWTT